jgi:hypothetical protein
MADISSQLSDIFKAGLDANPDLAKSLASAIHDDLGTGGKKTKAEANYRMADGSESCSQCQHFDGNSSCEVVSGHISPNGVSDEYEPGESADTGDSESSGESQSDTAEPTESDTGTSDSTDGSSDTGPKSNN